MNKKYILRPACLLLCSVYYKATANTNVIISLHLMLVYENVQNFTSINKKYPDTLVIETNPALLFYLILVCYREPILLKHLYFSIKILIVKEVLHKHP